MGDGTCRNRDRGASSTGIRAWSADPLEGAATGKISCFPPSSDCIRTKGPLARSPSFKTSGSTHFHDRSSASAEPVGELPVLGLGPGAALLCAAPAVLGTGLPHRVHDD